MHVFVNHVCLLHFYFDGGIIIQWFYWFDDGLQLQHNEHTLKWCGFYYQLLLISENLTYIRSIWVEKGWASGFNRYFTVDWSEWFTTFEYIAVRFVVQALFEIQHRQLQNIYDFQKSVMVKFFKIERDRERERERRTLTLNLYYKQRMYQ